METPIAGKPWLVQAAKWAYDLYIAASYDLHLEGREQLRQLQPPVIVACNHVSTLDPPIVQKSVPFIISTLAKPSLFSTPVKDWFLRSLYVRPLPEGMTRQALKELYDLSTGILQQEGNLMIYPEGQVTSDGSLLEFRAGISRIASTAQERMETPITLLPAAITYDPHHAIKGSRIFLTFGAPVDLKGYFARNHPKTLQTDLRTRIGNLVKVTGMSLVAQSLIETPEQDLDSLVDEVQERFWRHGDAGHNVDEAIDDPDHIVACVERLAGIPYSGVRLGTIGTIGAIGAIHTRGSADRIVTADSSMVPGHASAKAPIVGSEPLAIDERKLTWHRYAEGGCALLCKRGYPQSQANVHIIPSPPGYECIIEQQVNGHAVTSSRRHPSAASAHEDLMRYVQDHELLEDQVNLLRHLGNRIRHLPL